MVSMLGAGTGTKVRKRVEDAVQRRSEQHVVKFLDAVSRQDMKTVHDMLESGKVRLLAPGSRCLFPTSM